MSLRTDGNSYKKYFMNTFLSQITLLIYEYRFLLLTGLKNTTLIFISAACISFVLGFIWGCLRNEEIVPWWIAPIADFFCYLFQGIPFYLQLLISCFLIGPALNIKNELIIGTFSLGLCSAAYTSQIILSSIKSIAADQILLANSLGYSLPQKIIHIIIPQILPYVIPLFINECDQLIKSISILSTIGVLELTRSGLNIINLTFKPVPIYFFLAIIYLSFSFLLRYIAYLYKNKLYRKMRKI